MFRIKSKVISLSTKGCVVVYSKTREQVYVASEAAKKAAPLAISILTPTRALAYLVLAV